MKLNPAFKRRWVAALRSGAFRQGRGQLQDGGAFCCLGVACQLDGIVFGEVEPFPPSVAMRRWGLTAKQADFLTELNDGKASGGTRKHSFAEIADYIEANL